MNVRLPFAPLALLAATALAATSLGCGGDEQPYVPKPAVSGKKPSLAAVPTLPTKAKKVGDAYTIWGVTHDLRSRVHSADVRGKKISLVGYVVKTNYDTSPRAPSTRPARATRPTARCPSPRSPSPTTRPRPRT